MIDQLEEQPLVRMCGMIGRFFHIDPMIPAQGGYFDYAFRAAAFKYVQRREQEEQQRREAAAKAKRNG